MTTRGGLEYFCKIGDVDMVKKLLNDINVRVPADGSLILTAAKDGKYEIFKVLLDHGKCDITRNDNYLFKTCLMRGRDKMVKLLLNDPRLNLFISDYDSVMTAASFNYPKVVNVLLKDKRIFKHVFNYSYDTFYYIHYYVAEHLDLSPDEVMKMYNLV